MKQHLIRWVKARPALVGAIRTIRRTAENALPAAAAAGAANSVVPFNWSTARRDIAVPPDLVLRDVPVVPSSRFHREVTFDGGPVWPEFPEPPVVRHLVHGKMVDVNATPAANPGPVRSEPFVWGGRCLFHFGHLAAEHMNRIPGSLYRNPDAKVIFVLPPGKRVADVPRYFLDMTAWFGAPAERIHFVTKPFVAWDLHVSPQTEHMSADDTPAWYLDLLDELPRLNNLAPVPNRALYVHRCGQLAKGNGAHAGETALVSALKRAGVAIMDPGQGSIIEQMALYAGAKLLIFAEGSALHGRQLLGRVDQSILVLRRRPRSVMARVQIIPRCTSLEYAPVVGGFAAPVHRNGKIMLPHGITFTNLPELFRTMSAHGIDIEPHWDQEAYEADKARDAGIWIKKILSRPDIDRTATLAAANELFVRMGLPSIPDEQ